MYFSTLILLTSVLSLLVSAASIPKRFAQKTCFVCPAEDRDMFSLSIGIYAQGEPTICEYFQDTIAGHQVYHCDYDHTTGKLIEDHNGGACESQLTLAPCPKKASDLMDQTDDLFDMDAHPAHGKRGGSAFALSLRAVGEARRR